MYCPQCGQKRASEDVRFCSRCGFPLTEVAGLIARGGVAVEPPVVVSKRKKGLKQSGYLALAVVGLFILLLNTDADPDAAATVLVLGLVAAVLRAIYALAFQREKPRRPAPPEQLQTPPSDLLAPADTTPVAVPRTHFDTGEIVMEPPSVTEHTTRHLEQEQERER